MTEPRYSPSGCPTIHVPTCAEEELGEKEERGGKENSVIHHFFLDSKWYCSERQVTQDFPS